jgi:hypothetical protein
MAVLDRGWGKPGQSLARAAELPEGELRDLYVRRPSHRCLRTDLRNGAAPHTPEVRGRGPER